MKTRLLLRLLMTLMLMFALVATAAAEPSQESIEARHKALQEASAKIYRTTGDLEKVNRFLEKQGLKRVSTTGDGSTDVGILSTKYNVTISQPVVFWDSSVGQYYVYGQYSWNSYLKEGITQWYWMDDAGIGNGPVGGYDAVGLSFTDKTNLQPTSWAFTTFPLYSSHPAYNWTRPADYDAAGVVYAEQDATFDYSKWDYNFHSGMISMYVRSTGPGSTMVKFQLKHTWNSTNLSSVTISTSGISATVSGGTNEWTATNDQPVWFNH